MIAIPYQSSEKTFEAKFDGKFLDFWMKSSVHPNAQNALELAIQKWEFIATVLQDLIDENQTIRDIDGIGWKTCPLCLLYLHSADCVGCPIYEHTGVETCATTPYEDFELWKEVHGCFEPSDLQMGVMYADQEVGFLKSLRYRIAK